MKTTLCILATLLTTSLAVSIGVESTGTAENGYRLGHSGGLTGGRHTDISTVNDFKTLLHGNSGSSSGGYGSLDATGLSDGYNTYELRGNYNLGADGHDGSVSSATYINAPIGGHNNAHSSGVGGYSGGNNENIKIIRVIHEFVRPNHRQNHAKNSVSKAGITYKLIHDYWQNTGGLSGYAYLPINGHSSSGRGQITEEPSQIIKVIHENPKSPRNSPHSALSYSNFEQSSSFKKGSEPLKTIKALGAFASLGASDSYNVPSTGYSSPQTHYRPPSQEYFPPLTSGGYKYKL